MILQAIKGFLERHIVGNAPSSDVLAKYGINTLDLDRIAGCARDLKNFLHNEQENYFSTERFKVSSIGLPDEMKAILDKNVIAYLKNDDRFISLCGFSRGSIDDNWPAVEAGFAKYYAEKYFGAKYTQKQT